MDKIKDIYNPSFPMQTGYEFCRIGLKELTDTEAKEFDDYCGLVCDKCGSTKSEKWYIEKLINNYLPDNRLICERCK